MWHEIQRAPAEGSTVDELLVEVVVGAVVGVEPVALAAELVAVEAELETVDIVAVRTADIVVVHLALDEGAVDIDLVENLPVGEIEPLVEQRRRQAVEEHQAAVLEIPEFGAARVAGRAKLDLLVRADVHGGYDQAVAAVGGPSHGRELGPGEVRRTGSVAGLAADVDLRPGGFEGPGLGVIALDQIGRVALGAHPVPVLRVARPVKPVVGRDVLVGIEVEPLAADGVPGEIQTLEPTAGKGHEILLQRVVTEGVGDLEVAHFATGALGVDKKPAVPAKKPARDPVILDLDIIEVAEDRLFGGLGHGEIVIRAPPGLSGRLVTSDTAVAADEDRARRLEGGGRRPARRIEDQLEGDRQDDDGRGDDAEQDPRAQTIAR